VVADEEDIVISTIGFTFDDIMAISMLMPRRDSAASLIVVSMMIRSKKKRTPVLLGPSLITVMLVVKPVIWLHRRGVVSTL
jgi:hypothetical protein